MICRKAEGRLDNTNFERPLSLAFNISKALLTCQSSVPSYLRVNQSLRRSCPSEPRLYPKVSCQCFWISWEVPGDSLNLLLIFGISCPLLLSFAKSNHGLRLLATCSCRSRRSKDFVHGIYQHDHLTRVRKLNRSGLNEIQERCRADDSPEADHSSGGEADSNDGLHLSS